MNKKISQWRCVELVTMGLKIFEMRSKNFENIRDQDEYRDKAIYRFGAEQMH